MEKPKRSYEKYWTGTNQFDEIQFANDLEEYITALEVKLVAPTDGNLYELKLHEGISAVSLGKSAETYWQILRVPGGWIYTYWDCEKEKYNNGIFVPFNDEFSKQDLPL